MNKEDELLLWCRIYSHNAVTSIIDGTKTVKCINCKQILSEEVV